MRTVLAGYCLGIYLVSWLPTLSPNLGLIVCCVWAALFCLALLCRGKAALIFLFGLSAGLLWHWCWASSRIQQVLPASLEGQDLHLRGTVTGLPDRTGFGQGFDFLIDPEHSPLGGRKLRLNFFGAELVAPGESWQLSVRLKQPHGVANPGSYDREAQLLRNGYAATGYVRQDSNNRRLQVSQLAAPALLASARFRLLNHLQTELQAMRHGDLMLALILGVRDQLDSERWDLFTATGTNHLFVISGLHVGMVSMLCFRLTLLLFKLMPQNFQHWPAQRSAAIVAMGAAVNYSLLAGWGLPAQRACIMVLLYLSASLTCRRSSLGLRFMLAMAVVMSLDPLASASMGFWLSFIAVATLLFFLLPGQFSETQDPLQPQRFNLYRQYLRPQWIVFLGLLVPLSLLLGQVSVIAPFANLVTIPVLALALVPGLLLASGLMFVQPKLAHAFFLACDFILHGVLAFLELLQYHTGELTALVMPVIPVWFLILIVPGISLLLMPFGMPYRYLALLLLLPLFYPREMLDDGTLRVDVLDVGQGLAVLLRTQNHALLYDTGPGNNTDWNAGEAIVVPALRELGVEQLHRIMVSHGDADHAGGLKAIQASFPRAHVYAGAELETAAVAPCVSGQNWVWDGVYFSVLYPEIPFGGAAGARASNNQSCILRVSTGGFSVLLPGDIEAEVEHMLARDGTMPLASTVLIAPHHGSNTSSSYPFLKRVGASHVVITSGYGNGFGHPASAVVQRYGIMGIQIHSTALRGMVSFRGPESGAEPRISYYRQGRQRYWAWSGNPSICRYC